MAIVGTTNRSRSFRVNRSVITALMVLFLLYSLAPVFYLVVSATKSNQQLFSTFGFWFADFAVWDNLVQLFTHSNGIYLRWLLNSAVYSTSIALGAAILSTMAAYALSRFHFPGRNLMFAVILGAVMIPQTALVIPLFLMLTKIGLVDTMWAVILPSLVSPFGVFLMKAYIDESVPSELLDAARVDGAGEFRIFASIAFRLMVPGFATVVLLNFVWSWNNFFLPLVVLSSSANFPVTVGLSNWFRSAMAASGGAVLFSIVLMGALVSIIPVIILFLFMQRYWQGGLAAGAVKG